MTRPSAGAASSESSGAWTVHRGVRALATACAKQPRPVPAVGAVVLGPQTLTLRLGTPDLTPPAGWSAEDQGRAWTIGLEQLAIAPVDTTLPEPFPRLVSLGATGDGRMLLNLGHADGVISLEGDAARVRELARTWASRLTTSPWTVGLTVVRVGFDHDPAEWYTGVDVAHLAEVTRTLDGPLGGVLVLAHPPRDRNLEYVSWLAGEPRGRWSVVAIETPGARWRLTVDVAGTVETGLLDERARLRA